MNTIKKLFIKVTSYHIHRLKHLPVGTDIFHDLNRVFKKAETIFDVGANVGQTALSFSSRLNDSKIFSFEPVSMTFEKLNKNTHALNNVKCFNIALGSNNEEISIKIHNDSKSVLNSLKNEAMNIDGKLEKIKVVTGDTFCKEKNIESIDLLKIDTEGYELEVLNGFKKMIEDGKIKAIYCEVGFSNQNKRNTNFGQLLEFADNNNFVFFGLYDVVNRHKIGRCENYANALFVNVDVARNINPDSF